MRHAFLVMAHSEFKLLIKIIQMLDDDNNDIYIHIDKKSKNVPRDIICNAAKMSHVYFYQEYKIFWGTYTQTECELFLLEEAHKRGYDYYHLLSGADLPLVSQKTMQQFFEKHNGTEYVFMIEPTIDKKYYSWYSVYHPFQKYLRRSRCEMINKFFWILDEFVVKLQLAVGLDRVKDNTIIFQKGANWFSITNQFAEYVLSKKEWISKVFSCTRSSDEMFLQTVLINSPYFENLVYPHFENQDGYKNIRYIDWKRGSPYTFRKDDFSELIESNCLFARKFSQTSDPEIIDKIFDYVMKGY